MKLAIVGTGIAGITAASLLARDHEIVVFESQGAIGGHTVTTEVEDNGGNLAVDAGFIVYNEANYPNFVKLLDAHGVASQPSEMSFSVRCDRTGLEYAGTSLNTVFAQRSNLLRPGFYGLLRDIIRFNSAAKAALEGTLTGTLEAFLDRSKLSQRLSEHYLIPLTASIWSTDPKKILQAPADFILRFLNNHNLLETGNYHEWRVIKGGSARYVEKVTAPFRNRIRTSTPVRRLSRTQEGVQVATDSGTELFDEVVVAAHSDQALRMIERPSRAEREILGAIKYEANPAVLHSDVTALPKRRRAWASWNYRIPGSGDGAVEVTYNMTKLQSLPTETTYCVSLNVPTHATPESALRSFAFEHPRFSENAVAAQKRHREISGTDGIHYCGAYWGHGFHEDGVVSALEVCKRFGVGL